MTKFNTYAVMVTEDAERLQEAALLSPKSLTAVGTAPARKDTAS